MEHIVQFAIGIDDAAIAKRIEENAEKIIVQKIQQKLEKVLFVCDWNGNPTNHLKENAQDIFNDFLNDHKDEIIKCACDALAEKMVRTKVVRNAIENVLEGGKE